MNEAYDNARFIVHHLRGAGFQISLDDREIVVTPMSELQDNQYEMLRDRVKEVVRFLACECAVDQFLFVRAGGC